MLNYSERRSTQQLDPRPTTDYVREAEGRLVPTGETLRIACDQLFKAIGQTLVADDLGETIPAMQAGRIRIDGERRTSLAGVWAGGDAASGGTDLTVYAVEDGKQAAHSIDRTLRGTATKDAAHG